ncbi:hypothetical protein TSUD_93820 [Trifolium subterraneum]|uniref:Uncharacterized protein n=1 Tax=Trifolium subterraneum TaxID=3900 RepID=A0A2Z6PBN9_TRISU|nr:hypothetical protein TSUD_93820 [Trifolium subterraneum]
MELSDGNESLGLDDFNFNSFKNFWDIIKKELLVMFDQCHSSSKLSANFSSYFVTLIPKGFEVEGSEVSVSHLQYANETLIIGEACAENLWAMTAILRRGIWRPRSSKTSPSRSICSWWHGSFTTLLVCSDVLRLETDGPILGIQLKRRSSSVFVVHTPGYVRWYFQISHPYMISLPPGDPPRSCEMEAFIEEDVEREVPIVSDLANSNSQIRHIFASLLRSRELAEDGWWSDYIHPSFQIFRIKHEFIPTQPF